LETATSRTFSGSSLSTCFKFSAIIVFLSYEL